MKRNNAPFQYAQKFIAADAWTCKMTNNYKEYKKYLVVVK